MIEERRVTDPQREELCRLAKAPQPCFGKSRALVQRRLVRMGLALFINRDGSAAKMPELADLCEITDAGRAVANRKDVLVARASRVEEEPAPVPLVANVTSSVDPSALNLDALAKESKQWKRLEDGLDDDICQALIARVRALESLLATSLDHLEGVLSSDSDMPSDASTLDAADAFLEEARSAARVERA